MKLQKKKKKKETKDKAYLKTNIRDFLKVLEYPLMLEVVVVVPPLYCVGALLLTFDMKSSLS
jgi:hypothetical protein